MFTFFYFHCLYLIVVLLSTVVLFFFSLWLLPLLLVIHSFTGCFLVMTCFFCRFSALFNPNGWLLLFSQKYYSQPDRIQSLNEINKSIVNFVRFFSFSIFYWYLRSYSWRALLTVFSVRSLDCYFNRLQFSTVWFGLLISIMCIVAVILIVIGVGKPSYCKFLIATK